MSISTKAADAVREFAESIENTFGSDGEGIDVKMPAMLVFKYVKSEQDLLDRVNAYYQGRGCGKDSVVFAGNVNDMEEGFGLIEEG